MTKSFGIAFEVPHSIQFTAGKCCRLALRRLGCALPSLHFEDTASLLRACSHSSRVSLTESTSLIYALPLRLVDLLELTALHLTDTMSEPDNTFDTGDMAAALSDAGSDTAKSVVIVIDPPPVVPIEGAADRAREHGFVPPVAYDYDAYNANTREARESLAVEGGYIEPAWAATAVRYEWDDDFGDVGPEVPELEQELFLHENVMRKGNAFQVLEYKIHQEGPVQISPVRKVSLTVSY